MYPPFPRTKREHLNGSSMVLTAGSHSYTARRKQITKQTLFLGLTALHVLLHKIFLFLFHVASYELTKELLLMSYYLTDIEEAQQMAGCRRMFVAHVLAASQFTVFVTDDKKQMFSLKVSNEQLTKMIELCKLLASTDIVVKLEAKNSIINATVNAQYAVQGCNYKMLSAGTVIEHTTHAKNFEPSSIPFLQSLSQVVCTFQQEKKVIVFNTTFIVLQNRNFKSTSSTPFGTPAGTPSDTPPEKKQRTETTSKFADEFIRLIVTESASSTEQFQVKFKDQHAHDHRCIQPGTAVAVCGIGIFSTQSPSEPYTLTVFKGSAVRIIDSPITEVDSAKIVLPKLIMAPHCAGKFEIRNVSITMRGNTAWVSDASQTYQATKPLTQALKATIKNLRWCDVSEMLLVSDDTEVETVS